MTEEVNVCLFGLERVGKSTFASIVAGGDFEEDYIPTPERKQVSFKRTVEDVNFTGNIQDEPGASFKSTKTTASTYGQSGNIHIQMAAADSDGDIKFCDRYVKQPDYAAFLSDDYLFVLIITKKDLNGDCFGERPKEIADFAKGIVFTLDLHNKDEVVKCFDDILKAYGEKKNLFKEKKGGKAPKAAKAKGEKKGGCALL